MRIIGTGSALPHKIVTNDELAMRMETSDEWIRTRTGIQTRHLLSDDTLPELARDAALKALENANIGVEDIDYILCSHVYGSYITPSLSCVVQGLIGATCPGLDINGACTGFIYALDLADAMLLSGRYNKILIVCAEEMSRMVDWSDRATCVLFGDAAGAVVVEKGNALKSLRVESSSNTEFLVAKTASGNSPFREKYEPAMPMYMNGQEVYRFAVSSSYEGLKAVLNDAELTAGDIDHFLLHQANMRIIDAIMSRLGQPREKFPTNIARLGNTSSASIPVLLDELNRSGQLQPGDLLAMSAFGAGLTNGACVYQWN